MIPAFPLQWPAGWKRTPWDQRKRAAFGKARERFVNAAHRSLTITEGTERVLAELQRMGIGRDVVVISSNLQLRLDGMPRGQQAEPGDPGIAVYWTEGGRTPRVIAIDRYDRTADNLAAIAATLDAMRAIERHGGAVILERAFAGFTALPAPSATRPPREWWQVLGVSQNALPSTIRDEYRALRSRHHPDRGGDAATFNEIQQAYDQAVAKGFA
jgi:hypothetical protein